MTVVVFEGLYLVVVCVRHHLRNNNCIIGKPDGNVILVSNKNATGGNVGIGTTNPQNKLDVNGTIHSKQVIVDLNGWSDYVFKKDYTLTPLSDVKTYIDQNHHLPEIPSAEQVAKEGINLGEMNAKLLKKIEELTLYLIQQKEDLIQQRKDSENKLTSQQKEINELKERITILLKVK